MSIVLWWRAGVRSVPTSLEILYRLPIFSVVVVRCYGHSRGGKMKKAPASDSMKPLSHPQKAKTGTWVSLLKDPTIHVLTLSLIVGIMVVWWYTSRLQTQLVNSLALENARAYTHVLKTLRTVYTAEVINRVKPFGIETMRDYEKKPKALPIAAALTMKLGEAMSAQSSLVQARLYTTDPASGKQDKNAPVDQFAKEAWGALAKNPEQSFYRFAEIQGYSALRYATAWSDGEAQGVLEVIEPVENSAARAHVSMTETAYLLGVVGVVGFIMLFLVVGKVRRGVDISQHRTAALEKEMSERERVQRSLESEIFKRKKTEQEVIDAVNILATAANNILTATTQLGATSSQMAAAVNETTTTVEQVKQTASLSSQKAQQVAASAQRAAQISQSGKQATEDTISEMQRIREQMQSIAESISKLSEQSQAIREIIDTVNDLAEQSNLLAVNASIEAQKAGAYGSGFAVVAQEVRNLAQQSKDATAQVQAILNDIEKATSAAVNVTNQGTTATDLGMTQSMEAGEAIRTLAQSVEEAAQSATMIAVSNQQQAVGMEQLVRAMLNIQEGSAQTVTSSQQVESSAQQLHDLGQRLQRLSEQLAGKTGHSAPAPVVENQMAAAA
jgi:methyl-accepting chemotaxis protein